MIGPIATVPHWVEVDGMTWRNAYLLVSTLPFLVGCAYSFASKAFIHIMSVTGLGVPVLVFESERRNSVGAAGRRQDPRPYPPREQPTKDHKAKKGD